MSEERKVVSVAEENQAPRKRRKKPRPDIENTERTTNKAAVNRNKRPESEKERPSEKPRVKSSGTSKEKSREASKEKSRDTSREASKEKSRDTSREASKEKSKDISREASKEKSRDISRDISREASKEKTKDTSGAVSTKESGAKENETNRRHKKQVEEVEQKSEKIPEESGIDWLDDDSSDVLDDGPEEHSGRSMKKIGIVAAAVLGVLAVVYIGFALFFSSHFFFFTEINGINFSMKSEKAVTAYIKQQVADYELTIEEKGNIKEVISCEDIDLKYEDDEEVQQLLKQQSPFLWPKALFAKSSSKVELDVSYDEDKLKEKINQLKCVTAENQTEPVSAYPKYNNGKFVVEPEVIGTKVDVDRLVEEAEKYISSFQNNLNMEDDDCYFKPKYTSESSEVQEACDTMNKYCKASVTYNMQPNTEVVNGDLISTWLSYDDSMQVTFNTDAVRQYMREFGEKYDTVGNTRTITTPGGKTVEVSGGTYGWSIDEEAETNALIESIKSGEVTTKEPVYEQTAASHDTVDWGNTYCEVDLSSQHMWYVVDGSVALETDVVTGAGNDPNKITPDGVYQILELQSPSILKGEIQPDTGKPEYETEVSFWMRVTWSGIGFHDATWQSAFGGSRYVDGFGSHGCINMPYDYAQSLYGMLKIGTPVIIHY